MKLTDMDLNTFAGKIASNEPAPGGGSVAAYTSAMGISLITMVAELTTGKKKYAEHDELMKTIIANTAILRNKLLECVDKDTDAYNGVTAVFKMPKETDEEKAARGAAMQSALKLAALVPLEVMELSLSSLKIAQQAVGKSNQNAATDLGVAAQNLRAGIKGAWLNVLINLGSVKDEKFLNDCLKAGTEYDMEGEKISQSIQEEILKSIM